MGLLTPNIEQVRSRTEIDIECDYCHSQFRRIKKDAMQTLKRNNGKIFCSRSCARDTRIAILCKFCGKTVKRRPTELGKNTFCSYRCSGFFYNTPKKKIRNSTKKLRPNTLANVNCSNCGKTIQRDRYAREHHKFFYCNRSCQAIYANKTYNRAGRFGRNRSKAEDELSALISTEFPNMGLVKNDRSTIVGGLELDLWLPSVKIAIELNGPCHYIPLFGTAELTRTMSKDEIKKQECQRLGIRLFIINIMGAGKRLPRILLDAFNNHIKPLIVDSLSAKAAS